MAAIEENHLEVVRFLVSSGANVNYRTKVVDNILLSRITCLLYHNAYSLQKGMSPLLCACDCGNTDIVKLLIQVNANTELKNKVGVVLTIVDLDNHS